MNLSLFLFLIGILGFILNRKNIILMIIAIEIMLLAVTLLVLISSFTFDDGIGQTFSIFIISVAGAESVIGLSILVGFYRSFVLIVPVLIGEFFSPILKPLGPNFFKLELFCMLELSKALIFWSGGQKLVQTPQNNFKYATMKYQQEIKSSLFVTLFASYSLLKSVN